MSQPRLRAPSEDGGVLAVPPLDAAGDLIASNRARLSPFAEARRQVAQQVIDRPTRRGPIGPFIVGGHQPELFHPGVWLKNFAIHSLAAKHDATPINLVVDNDTLKSPSIRLPFGVRSSNPSDIRHSTLAFDTADGEVPFEEREIRDQATFESFGDRLAEATRSWPFEAMGIGFWPRVVAQAARTNNLGECLAAARRCVEREWGVTNLELSVSRLAHTGAFRSFVAIVLAELPRFHAAYNFCVANYRRAHRVRSRSHPVPDLGRDGDWFEAPFWGWRTGAERRGRLYARRSGDRVEIRVSGESWTVLSFGGIEEGLRRLEEQGHKLRPRALSLTMFARLYLADVFVHGIGGGKYDELTDAIISSFFQVRPPAYMVLAGTLRLPDVSFRSRKGDLHRLERIARDLEWNPQRHLPPRHGRDDLVEQLLELQEANPMDADARRERFVKARELKEQFADMVIPRRAAIRSELARVKAEVAANDILCRRDYSFVLFPESALRDWLSSATGQPASRLRPIQL